MRLIIASNNNNKIKEIKQIIGGFFTEIVSQREAGIEYDVEENGTTFEDNAIKKAKEIFCIASRMSKGHIAVLADDSGIMVDALNGAPGVYSARFAGEGHDDDENNKKLLAKMQGVTKMRRGCRFVSAIALVKADGSVICVRGEVEGRLLEHGIGENGFGYDPLFFYEPAGLTFGQMSDTAKNKISHRRNALEAMRRLLDNEYEGL